MLLNTIADFRSLLQDDTRRAWSDLLDRRRGEQICAFALVTSDDFLGASAVGDTIERREQRLVKRPSRNRAETTYHEWAYAWNTGEWDSIYSADQPCQQPSLLDFNSMLAFEQAWLSGGHSERAFKRNMLRAMVDVLADLDKEGLFGKGDQREGLTLFVEITDSYDEEVAKLKTARLLNPPKSARRLTGSLPFVGHLLVCGMSVVGWVRRGRLIAS